MKFTKEHKGMSVTLKPGTRYFRQNINSNPANVKGIIDYLDDEYNEDDIDDLFIHVIWKNGTANCYNKKDLMLTNSSPTYEIY